MMNEDDGWDGRGYEAQVAVGGILRGLPGQKQDLGQFAENGNDAVFVKDVLVIQSSLLQVMRFQA